MNNVPINKFVSRYRKPLFALYALLLAGLALLAIEKAGSKSYWVTLISTAGAFYIIESFLVGRTITLSVYDLPPNKNAFYSFMRVFWFFAAFIILWLAVAYAFEIPLPKNT